MIQFDYFSDGVVLEPPNSVKTHGFFWVLSKPSVWFSARRKKDFGQENGVEHSQVWGPRVQN